MIPLDAYKASIGQNIRTRRNARGMSLREFGAMAGVHHNQLQQIELGRVNPSLSTLYRIADGLDIDLSDLFVD